MLQPRYRQAIEQAFGCRVHDRYASAESGFIAFECAAGGIHVASESHLVEIVRADGRPAQPGESGDVLITTFRSRTMPLVRYRLGDVAVAPDGRPCPCGRGLPLLGELVGRSNSILRTPAGGLVAPTVVGSVVDDAAESVVEYQLVQRPDLRLELKVVQRDSPSPEQVRADLAAALDRAISFDGGTTVERVATIERSVHGKFNFIVSHADGAAVR
jgi:phenylacetate-CoA ligase